MNDTVEFALTLDDYLAFQIHHRQRASKMSARRALVGWLLAVSLLVGMYLLFILRFDADSSSVIAVMIPFVLIVLVLRALPKPILKHQAKKLEKQGHLRKILAGQTFTITPTGIAQSGEFGTSQQPWKSIFRIDSTESHVFFYQSPSTALLVPARAFANQRQFEKFVSDAREYQNAAPSYQRHCPKCGYDCSQTPHAGCPECGWRREQIPDA